MSRTDKNTRILMLYDALLNGNGINKKTFSMEHGIDERSFDRDIEDIRLFLSDSFSCEELLFDRGSNTYYLSGSRPKYMDRMEATVISKILLESGLLRKDEMHGLLNSIFSSVTERDAKALENHLLHDILSYKSNIDVDVLKFVEDLYVVIKSGYDIEATMQDKTIRLSPLEISCENQAFHLVAAADYSLENIVKIDIQDILRFKKLFSNHAETLKEKYFEIEETHK